MSTDEEARLARLVEQAKTLLCTPDAALPNLIAIADALNAFWLSIPNLANKLRYRESIEQLKEDLHQRIMAMQRSQN